MGGKTKKNLQTTTHLALTVKPKKKKIKTKTVLTQMRVKGKGGYSLSEIPALVAKPFTDDTKSKGVVNKIARGIGSAVGSALPIPGLSEPLGNAASWLARAFGFGAYTIRKNSLMTQNIAQFADNGSMTFAHREYITDITSSVNFNNQSFLINPGNALLFPWLSKIASNYEEFEFLGLIFEFKSMSADAVGSTNTGLGTLIMATDYDVVDAPYATKQEMEIADFATSDAPCYHQIHPVECDPRQNVMKKMFVQNATTLAGYPDDPRFSVLGNFQVATQGVQSASNCGELWVSYHVRLSKPQLARGIASQQSAHVTAQNLDGAGMLITATNVYPNNGGLRFQYDSLTSVNTMRIICNNTLGIGSYLVSTRCQGSTNVGTLTGSAPLTSGTATFLNNYFSYSDGTKTARSVSALKGLSQDNYSNDGTNYLSAGGICSAVFTLNAIGDYVAIPIMAEASGAVYIDLIVTPYDHVNVAKPLSEKETMRKQLNDLYMKFSSLSSPSPIGSPDPSLNNNFCNTQGDESPEYCTIDQHSIASNNSSLVSRIPGVGAFNLQLPGSARRA